MGYKCRVIFTLLVSIFLVFSFSSCEDNDDDTEYVVTFDANGGTGTMSKQTFVEGKSKELRENAFTRSGYTFNGWATTSTGSATYTDKQSIKISKDQTLYAVWKSNASSGSGSAPSATCTVTFNENGGSGTMPAQTFTKNVAQTLTANAFTRSGYTFSGWATSPSGSVKYSNRESITISESITLYAKWKYNYSSGSSSSGSSSGGSYTPPTYTVSFNGNGGTFPAGTKTSCSGKSGATLSTPENDPTKAGSVFKGWATSPSATTPISQFPTTITGTKTYYAVWGAAAPIGVDTSDLTLTASVSYSADGNTANLTATEGFTGTYTWTLNGSSKTGSTVTFDISSWNSGDAKTARVSVSGYSDTVTVKKQ